MPSATSPSAGRPLGESRPRSHQYRNCALTLLPSIHSALLQHVVDTIEAGTSAHAFDVVSVLIQYQREAVEDDEH